MPPGPVARSSRRASEVGAKRGQGSGSPGPADPIRFSEPGGDRSTELLRDGELFVISEDGCLEILGTFTDKDSALDAWIEQCVPGDLVTIDHLGDVPESVLDECPVGEVCKLRGATLYREGALDHWWEDVGAALLAEAMGDTEDE